MTDRPALTLSGFHPEFAALADQIAGQRIGAYADRFSPQRIFIMRAIAEIWRCARDNATPAKRFLTVTRDQALEELAMVIETAERRARHRPDDRERQQQLEQLTAMRWWHAQYKPHAYALNMAFLLRFDGLQALLQAEDHARRDAA